MCSRWKVSTTKASSSYNSMREPPGHFTSYAGLIPLRMQRRQLPPQQLLCRSPQPKTDSEAFSRRFPPQDLRHRLVHYLDSSPIHSQPQSRILRSLCSTPARISARLWHVIRVPPPPQTAPGRRGRPSEASFLSGVRDASGQGRAITEHRTDSPQKEQIPKRPVLGAEYGNCRRASSMLELSKIGGIQCPLPSSLKKVRS